MLARLTIAAGGAVPTVWETEPTRILGAEGYEVLNPTDDRRRDYASVYDASGVPQIMDQIWPHLAKGGEIVLAGFYAQPVRFTFPPAFMKEARIRIAAEWNAYDLTATRDLIEGGHLSLNGLITHIGKPGEATDAYTTAFSDPACFKMILDWEGQA